MNPTRQPYQENITFHSLQSLKDLVVPERKEKAHQGFVTCRLARSQIITFTQTQCYFKQARKQSQKAVNFDETFPSSYVTLPNISFKVN